MNEVRKIKREKMNQIINYQFNVNMDAYYFYSHGPLDYLSHCWAILFRLWHVLLPNTLNMFGFTIFRLLAYLMNVIPETRHAH
jgi:hypothetical protein